MVDFGPRQGRTRVFAAAVVPPIIVPYGVDGVSVIMIGFYLPCSDRKEGIARLEVTAQTSQNETRRTFMINNSSLQKWDRLAQKQLDQQFINCRNPD